MATRLMTPFCAASALFAALVADGALPNSWAQLKAGPALSAAKEAKPAAPTDAAHQPATKAG